MKRINEDVIVNDPALSNKYMLAQRQINDRLKKIAQIQTEIVKYKQEMAKIEQMAIKKQAATIKATNIENDPQAQQQLAQGQNGQIIQSNESRVPTYDEFLLERELINEEYDGVAIVGMTKELSRKFGQNSENHTDAIQNMMLNAYQMQINFSSEQKDSILGAWNLMIRE